MYICIKFSQEDLNSNHYSPYLTKTYIYRVTIMSKIRGGVYNVNRHMPHIDMIILTIFRNITKYNMFSMKP